MHDLMEIDCWASRVHTPNISSLLSCCNSAILFLVHKRGEKDFCKLVIRPFPSKSALSLSNMANFSAAAYVLTPLTAITFHETILRRVEVDHLVLPLLAFSSTVHIGLAYCTGISQATTLCLTFWVTLWMYIGAYRVFFHPLRNFPGPLGARLSKWYTVKKVIDTRWHWYRVQQELQKKYGDYVRTGPRELSIFDPEAVQALLGPQSKTSKGPFYDVMEKSLHLNRDKPWHRQRRRIWDNAMKTSLSGFAPQIEKMCNQLLERLRRESGEPVLLLETMTYFSYDVTSALAFGRAMGFTTGESSKVADGILNTFTQSLSAMGIMYHMPWLMNALTILTSVAGPLKDWTDWSVSQMETRMAVSSERQLPAMILTKTRSRTHLQI